ncbi:tubulin monoglycylase TTLL3 isoform X1 [Oncorhynchus kisutch]|uniref:tubulin monoglycylase TTLL3 isoform X1 n=1 Tax=Oncorhynchus kisutch TaxID=8019 RepID=UPI0012DDDD4C|nr:tubulin monoglycylase TTLL3-like isoform X1 [Oncorhynchus kisutch]
MQHMPQGRVRCSPFNLPEINPDRLKTAKALVEKAVQLRRVFTVQGPYPVIRAALQARGWVERRLPHPAPKPAGRCHGEEDGEDGDDSNDDNDKGVEGARGHDPDDMYDLMSRLVRNETTYFYWTTRRDEIDCRSLRKDQMTNHYAKSGTFTTKVGLCVNLRNLQWFDATNPDTFFPRCYRLGADDEKHAFIEDFRRTACTSLLQHIVERSDGEEEKVQENLSQSEGIRVIYCTHTINCNTLCHSQCQANKSSPGPRKHRATRLVSPRMIDRALHVCQEFLNSLDHSDIDVTMETPPSLTEQQWVKFMHDYYLVVHEGVGIEGSGVYVERCQAMLNRLQVCPQLETDGLHNIWIIKPGAKSRGRGIMCMNRLEDILRLVDSDPSLIKDSKWVVQKYLERPLLVYATKFDLRQWFLVTDWNPLTVWFYRECYLRFSTQPYSTQTLASSVHLCNNSIQKHFQPSQWRHPEVPKDNMWSCSQFRAFLHAQGQGASWGALVVPGMQRAVVHALQTAQDLVEGRRGSFELYGADFMLGRDLRPWLLEINASPTMAPSTAVTARLCPAVQLDTLKVVLDRRADPGAYTGGFQLIYKQATVEVPQYMGVNLLVEGAPLRRPRLPPHRIRVILDPPLTTHIHTRTNQSASETEDKPSSHRPSPCRHPSGKENQSRLRGNRFHKRDEEGGALGRQHTSPTLRLSQRMATERPLALHSEHQKGARCLGMSRNCPLRLVPRTLSHSLSTPCGILGGDTHPFHPNPHPRPAPGPCTARPFLPQSSLGPPRKAPTRNLPTLYGPIPALEVFGLRPSPLTEPLSGPNSGLRPWPPHTPVPPPLPQAGYGHL